MIVIVGVLVVNYFKDKKGETIPALTTQTEVGSTHTVVAGETLWSIAEDNYGSGYNWVDIKSANSLTTDTIEIGQELSIPQVSAKTPTSTVSIEQTETLTSIDGGSYTVTKGDSLWSIAVRSYGDGYKWVDIAKANELVNPNIIHPGNVLTLPR